MKEINCFGFLKNIFNKLLCYFHYGESIDDLTGEYLNTGKTKGSVAKSRTRKQIKKYVKYFKKYKLYKYVK